MFDIYLITNLKNGKSYVGLTQKGFLQRRKEHKHDAKYRESKVLCYAIRKYGEERLVKLHTRRG